MAAIVFIGDELACAGFRLTGVDTRSPAPADLAAEFAQALATARLVVLARRCAAALPADVRIAAMLRVSPLVVVMSDITEPQSDADFVRRMRMVLGIES